GPEALVAEAERVEDDESDHDRVAHEHDRRPVVRFPELAHAGPDPVCDLGKGLPSDDAQEMRRGAPAPPTRRTPSRGTPARSPRGAGEAGRSPPPRRAPARAGSRRPPPRSGT